jgi:hypothetical protein
MATTTASERVMLARAAAHARWAQVPDRTAATAPGRKAFMVDRFEREVDPDSVLEPQERAKRAASARKAYFCRLSLKAAQARRRKAGK